MKNGCWLKSKLTNVPTALFLPANGFEPNQANGSPNLTTECCIFGIIKCLAADRPYLDFRGQSHNEKAKMPLVQLVAFTSTKKLIFPPKFQTTQNFPWKSHFVTPDNFGPQSLLTHILELATVHVQLRWFKVTTYLSPTRAPRIE